MPNLNEVLPFLIPIIIIEFGLLIYVIHHILNHNTYKRGTRTMWLIICIVGMQFIGPILYLLLGKQD